MGLCAAVLAVDPSPGHSTELPPMGGGVSFRYCDLCHLFGWLSTDSTSGLHGHTGIKRHDGPYDRTASRRGAAKALTYLARHHSKASSLIFPFCGTARRQCLQLDHVS